MVLGFPSAVVFPSSLQAPEYQVQILKGNSYCVFRSNVKQEQKVWDLNLQVRVHVRQNQIYPI